ncbi:thioredoxin family protein [bacterium]|nr:thioredoxin family protein [bacterium]
MRIALVGLALLWSVLSAGAAQVPAEVVKFLSPPSVTGAPGSAVSVAVPARIADGWHINSDKPIQEYLLPTTLTFEAQEGFVIGEVQYPPAVQKAVALEGAPVALWMGQISFRAQVDIAPSVPPGLRELRGSLRYQACDDEKCLPPRTAEIRVPVTVSAPEKRPAGRPSDPADTIRDLFRDKGIFLALLYIFIAGLLLNLTPCVYPMIPITVAVFAGRGDRAPPLAALAYFLGIVVTYSILGTVAGLTGGLFGAILQNPWVLIGLAGLMVYMAAAMFGWVPFGFDSAAQKLSTGGVPLGTFGLGATLGIVAAPCIGPVIVALLAYVGKEKSAALGFALFGVFASGLGLPYLVLGLLPGKLRKLPKLGEWMARVKWIFGFLLLGLAVYFVAPLIPDSIESGLYTAILAAAGLTAVGTSLRRGPLSAAVGLLLGIALLAGAWHARPVTAPPSEEDVFWIEYDDYSFDAARSAGYPVLLDFFAEWCAPCKKLDRETWSDTRVRRATERVVRLKIDLTLFDSPESASLMKRFDIHGVPTTLYFDAAGKERLRYEGFFPPEVFLADLNR